jgi:hypothetical protein
MEIDPLTKSVFFPDLRIDATTIEGEPIIVFAEHKWDSPCRLDQLKIYRGIADKAKFKAWIAFVGKSRDQVVPALASEYVGSSMYWEDVYKLFESLPNQSQLLQDFLFFMKSQGSGTLTAVTPEKLKAYVESDDLPFQLSMFCRKLADEYDWSKIPERYHGDKQLPVEDRYGRVAIEFSGAKWAPNITLGFLYSNRDHRVPFTDPGRSIDLLLRIEASSELNPNPDSLLKVLKYKMPSLKHSVAQALVKGDRDNRNRHTLLIVQRSLSDLLQGIDDTDAQLNKIYETFDCWLSILFDDESLEPELIKLRS